MSLERETGINNLPDETLLKIFQYLREQHLCRVSKVCKRFQKIANDTLLWQSLYQEIYEYDQPLFYFEPCEFKFESPNVSENPWKESFRQLYRGVHVRRSFKNLTFEGCNLQYFDTIYDALNYVKNDKLNVSSQHLIFVHSGTHNLDDTIIIDSNVALIGAASGIGHQIANLVNIKSNDDIDKLKKVYVEKDIGRVYIGYLTLQVHFIITCKINSFIISHDYSNPIIEYCIISKGATVADRINPLIKNCDISNCENITRPNAALYVTSSATGIYEDNTISCHANGISISYYAKPTMRRNNIHHNRAAGIYILNSGSGCFENNKIHDNETGFEITSGWQLSIQKNKIYNCKNGLDIKYSKGLITHNNIYNNVFTGIKMSLSKTIVQCNKIYNNCEGIYMHEKSKDLIKENEVYDNSSTNVLIMTGSKPTLKKNRIYGQQIGVHFDSNGYGTLEENIIYSHLRSGVRISDRSKPKILNNKIWDNQEGVSVHNTCFGLLKQNYIFNSAMDNVKIENSNLILECNYIFGGQGRGISMLERSRGILKQNHIYENTQTGILISTRSRPKLIRNVIYCNGLTAGIEIIERATATLESNTIFRNRYDGLWLEDGIRVTQRGNNIHDNNTSRNRVQRRKMFFCSI